MSIYKYTAQSAQDLALLQQQNGKKLQHIHSFVRREGRITGAQQRALTEYQQRFIVEISAALFDPVALFGRDAPLILEIGFGDGEALLTMASSQPECDYLGIEVYRPGIGHLLLRANALEVRNLRVVCGDAVEVLEQWIPDASLQRIQVFFPDPWPKARHHKRRLIQAERIALWLRKIKLNGQLHLATDCEHYAQAMLEILNAMPELVNSAADTGFVPRPAWRPLTKFEERGQRLGHVIRDLLFIRRSPRGNQQHLKELGKSTH